MDEEQSTPASRDPGARRQELVGEPTRRTLDQGLVPQDVAEPVGAYAVHTRVERDQGDELAGQAGELHLVGAVHPAHESDGRGTPGEDEPAPVELRQRQQRGVREDMLDAGPTEGAQKDQPLRTARNRLAERELRIALVLLRGEHSDLDPPLPQGRDGGGCQRVAVADDQVGYEAELLRAQRAAVRGDDESRCLAGEQAIEDRGPRRIAVRDDDRGVVMSCRFDQLWPASVCGGDGGGSWTPFAGTNQIRFRGSAAVPALSAPHRRSPVPFFDCPQYYSEHPRPTTTVAPTPAVVPPERARARARLAPVPDQQVHAAHQRVLDAAARKGIELDIRTFPETTHTAEDAASAVGAAVGQIVKSLVFVAERDGRLEPFLVLVSGANRVDVARLAAVLGEPDVRRANAREAGELTGFVIGGIPPMGHARTMRVVMDPDLGRFPLVWAAAGTQNAVFAVPPATLRILANATVAPIALGEDQGVERGVSASGGPAEVSAATGA